MSGHSKWANIKRKKGANDVARSKVFSKMSRLIYTAAKQGGGDVDANPALRLAVEKAKYEKMPKDKIDYAIQKATGGQSAEAYEEVVYEGYGPSGVAFLVKALTDNRNRTVAEIKTIFNKNGGSLGTPGSTAYLFDPTTMVPSYSIPIEEEKVQEKLVALEEALEEQDDVQEIYSNYEFI